jgi:hypothetical protein
MAHMTSNVLSDDSLASKDRETLWRLTMVIDEKMANPFRNQTSVNITTGHIADSDKILQAKEKGLSALSEAEERGSFKVEKMKLKPLDKVKRKVPISKTQKSLHMEESSYPSSLFQPDEENLTGYSMRKGNKADFVNALQVTLGYKNSRILPQSSDQQTFCIDMMAFVQQLRDMGSKIFELQQRYLHHILSSRPQNCKVLHIIGDKYDTTNQSLKYEERV